MYGCESWTVRKGCGVISLGSREELSLELDPDS